MFPKHDESDTEDGEDEEDSNEEHMESPRSHNLIIEATEYFVLTQLCLHLSEYFENPRYPKAMLTKLLRNNIPDVLLSNHFLELFSRPMNERERFLAYLDSENLENIYSSYGKGGAIFDKFELILPSHSKIKRKLDNSIEIETDRFIMTITIVFEGFNTFIPYEFHEYVLQLDMSDPESFADFQVQVKIDVSFKLAAFLSPGGWDYYYWVDSFFHALSERFEEEKYFQSIGWEQALTVLNFLESRIANKKSSSDDS